MCVSKTFVSKNRSLLTRATSEHRSPQLPLRPATAFMSSFYYAVCVALSHTTSYLTWLILSLRSSQDKCVNECTSAFLSVYDKSLFYFLYSPCCHAACNKQFKPALCSKTDKRDHYLTICFNQLSIMLFQSSQMTESESLSSLKGIDTLDTVVA